MFACGKTIEKITLQQYLLSNQKQTPLFEEI